MLLSYLDKIYIYTILEILYDRIKIRYTRPLQKIIGPNIPSTNNVLDILTLDLDKQIVHNRVTKYDSILDAYISSPLKFEPKPDGG